jgi:hypothetical protein
MKASIKEESLGLKRLQALAFLDQSNERLEQANDALKSFHWNLTKARQSRRSSSLSTLAFSACDVREEFAAQYRLVEQPEKPTKTAKGNSEGSAPDLIQEEQNTTARGDSLADLMSGIILRGNKEGISLREVMVPSLVLVSVSDVIQSEKENAAVSGAPPAGPIGASDNNKSADGLRSRRGKSKSHTEAGSSEWTVENQGSASALDGSGAPSSSAVLDSMDLFGWGLTPRELKLAKEKAQEALRLYVQAANHRRQLLTILSQPKELAQA